MREPLFNKILRAPLSFTKEDELEARKYFTFEDIRELMRRIYNLNEAALLEISDASSGLMGWANARGHQHRLKKYRKKIKKGHRMGSGAKGNKVILAEGDSWFLFPFLIREIIDWLSKLDDRNAIYSIAYAGDWLTNIIYEGKYIEELDVHQPDAFLISGGGNDLLGDTKLAVMLKKPDALESPSTNPKDYVRTDFYSFVLTIKIMYFLIFDSIKGSSKFDQMTIITQGYDYAFPRRPKFQWSRPLSFLSGIYGSGEWLAEPMDLIGIPDERTGAEYDTLRRDIIKYMIDAINEMFIDVGTHYTNVFHIDCRGVAPLVKDWFDEIHLKKKRFKQIAQVYNKIIHTDLSQLNQKVFKVVNEVK